MLNVLKTSSALLLALSLLNAAPVLAQELDRASEPGADPSYYLLQAEQLGASDAAVTVRFEFREGDRIVDTHRVLASLEGAASRLVELPASPAYRALLRGDEAMTVRVFADGMLLATFDREQLEAYNRILGYTRAAERDLRSIPSKIQCNSPCGGGCGPYDDYDCDGHNNISDNCTDDHNPNQADCDGDGIGDVCDVTNGSYQPSGVVDTCMTDKDHHGGYITFEHHVEERYIDVSSCGSPDTWNRWIREDNDCVGISDWSCCDGLRFSISEVGDSPAYWCSSGVRNVDFCN